MTKPDPTDDRMREQLIAAWWQADRQARRRALEILAAAVRAKQNGEGQQEGEPS